MPVQDLSRHLLTTQRFTEDGEQQYLDDRVPYRFRDKPGTQIYTAKEGDSLFFLAAKFYATMPRPAGMWWVIADFQPQPIHDPTLTLQPGRVIYIPSQRVVSEEIINESRRGTTITTDIGDRGR